MIYTVWYGHGIAVAFEIITATTGDNFGVVEGPDKSVVLTCSLSSLSFLFALIFDQIRRVLQRIPNRMEKLRPPLFFLFIDFVATARRFVSESERLDARARGQ